MAGKPKKTKHSFMGKPNPEAVKAALSQLGQMAADAGVPVENLSAVGPVVSATTAVTGGTLHPSASKAPMGVSIPTGYIPPKAKKKLDDALQALLAASTPQEKAAAQEVVQKAAKGAVKAQKIAATKAAKKAATQAPLVTVTNHGKTEVLVGSPLTSAEKEQVISEVVEQAPYTAAQMQHVILPDGSLKLMPPSKDPVTKSYVDLQTGKVTPVIEHMDGVEPEPDVDEIPSPGPTVGQTPLAQTIKTAVQQALVDLSTVPPVPGVEGTTQAFLTVSHKDGTGEKEIKATEEVVKVERFLTAPATISMEMGLTLNLGNYESARITVGIASPCYKEHVDQTYEKAKDWLVQRLQKEVKEIRDNSTGKPLF